MLPCAGSDYPVDGRSLSLDRYPRSSAAAPQVLSSVRSGCSVPGPPCPCRQGRGPTGRPLSIRPSCVAREGGPSVMRTVSVVIACDSRARSIPGCLDSVLAQAGADVEVLLVDRGSNDWTSAVVAAAARSDPRVRVVLGRGGPPTIADALASASGDYTVLLNVDDRLAP